VRPDAAVAAASGAVLADPNVEAGLAQQVGRLVYRATGEGLRSEGDERGRRGLDDLDTPGAVRLKVRDGPRGDAGAESLSKRLHMLEPVEKRHDDAFRDRRRIDPLDRLFQHRRLHRHEQQIHRLHEPLGDLHACSEGPVARLHDEPRQRDEGHGLRVSDADRADPREREPHGK
jgi:hypothetical protein